MSLKRSDITFSYALCISSFVPSNKCTTPAPLAQAILWIDLMTVKSGTVDVAYTPKDNVCQENKSWNSKHCPLFIDHVDAPFDTSTATGVTAAAAAAAIKDLLLFPF